VEAVPLSDNEDQDQLSIDDTEQDAEVQVNEGQDEKEDHNGQDGQGRRSHRKRKQRERFDTGHEDSKEAAPSKKRSKHKQEKYAEAGIIQKIVLKHFMNHRNLIVPLHPNVTVLHGKNGSGKSALLSGIIFCLGGHARTTGRGNKATELIQDGQNWCEVQVTIKNEGSEAYKPEEYGKSITVVRKVTKNDNGAAGNTYTMLSEKKTKVASKRADLDAMLDHFNIDVTNPCVIMQQDHAKDYLRADANKKAELFRKATNLSKFSDRIEEADGLLQQQKENLEQVQEDLKRLKRVKKECEDKYQASKELQATEQEIVKVQVQYSWALIKRQEDELDTLREELKLYSDKREQKEEQLSAIERRQAASADERNQLEASQAAADKAVQDHDTMRQRLDQNTKQWKKKLMEADRKAQGQQQQISKQEKIKDEIEERLSQLRQEEMKDMREEEKAKHKKLSQLTQSTKAEQKKLTALQCKGREAGTLVEECANELKELRHRRADNRRRFHAENGRLRDLAALEKNKLNVFGSFTEDLQAAIDQSTNKFTHKPLGPIGAYIKLASEEAKGWQAAIESVVPPVLMRAYLVHNKADLAVLQQIMQRVVGTRGPCPAIKVFPMPQAKYSLRYAAVGGARGGPPAHPNVAKLIEIANPWVHNCVAVDSGFEGWLCMNRSGDAFEAVKRSSNSLRGVVLRDGEKVVNNKGTVSRMPQHRARPMLNVDAGAERQRVENTLKELKEEFDQFDAQIRDYEEVKQQKQEELNHMRGQIQASENKIHRLEEEIEELSVDQDDSSEEIEFQLELLRKAEDKIGHFQALLEEAQHKMKELKHKCSELEKQRKEEAQRGKIIAKECLEATAQLEAFERSNSSRATSTHKLAKRVQDLKKQEQKLGVQISEKLTTVQAETQKLLSADATKERVDSSLPLKSIVKKLQKLQARMKESQRLIGGDFLSIQTAYHNAQKNYDRAKTGHASCKEATNSLAEAEHERKINQEKFERRVRFETRLFFAEYMANMGHAGDIQFGKDIIDFRVKMKGDRRDIKGTSGVSGGEGAFIVNAFIMAVNESIQSPFSAMDEFDCFMDAVSRAQTVKRALIMAKSQQKRQYIFLTPQDVSGFPSNDEIYVYKLTAPERGQMSILDYQR